MIILIKALTLNTNIQIAYSLVIVYISYMVKENDKQAI